MSMNCQSCKHDKELGCSVHSKDWPYANNCRHWLPIIQQSYSPRNYNTSFISGEFEEMHPVHKDKSMRYALLP